MRCVSGYQDTMFCLKICIAGVMVMASLASIDAGDVVLGPKYPVRLVPIGCENATIAAGRVEILVNETWGAVCDDNWTEKEARVVCNMLGHTNTTPVAVRGGILDYVEGKSMLDEVYCVGNETELADCRHLPFGQDNCYSPDEASVLCLSDEPNVKVRLAGTSVEYMGRVEVQAFGIWGTVCKYDFGLEEVSVICRLLGYPGTGRVEAVYTDIYGEGEGPVWMSKLGCFGNETAIEDCPRAPWGDDECSHSKDVGIYCDQD